MTITQVLVSKIKPYLFPDNPIDSRILSRVKLGLLNYSQVKSYWSVPFIKSWIKKQCFTFTWKDTSWKCNLLVSGGDITHLWVANEIFIERVYDLSTVPFVPDVVLDLGSNIGLFTILAANKWQNSTFICVEPHPVTFSFLCKNLERNGIVATKFQCAVDTSTGIKFLKNEGSVFQQVSEFGENSNQIFTVPLDALIPDNCNSKLLIKMDIEGAEYPVLQNMSSKLPDYCFIFIELHHGDTSIHWIKKWSAENKFKFHEVRRRGEAIDGYLKRIDHA